MEQMQQLQRKEKSKKLVRPSVIGLVSVVIGCVLGVVCEHFLMFTGIQGGSTAIHKVSPFLPKPNTHHIRLGVMGSCRRGTGRAMYDYGDWLNRLVGLQHIFYYCVTSTSREANMVDMFRKRFGEDKVHDIGSWPKGHENVDALLWQANITHLYMIKHGKWDGIVTVLVW